MGGVHVTTCGRIARGGFSGSKRDRHVEGGRSVLINQFGVQKRKTRDSLGVSKSLIRPSVITGANDITQIEETQTFWKRNIPGEKYEDGSLQ